MIYTASYFSFPSSINVKPMDEERKFRFRMARAIKLATSSRRAVRIRQRVEIILDQIESHVFGCSDLEDVEQKIGIIRRYFASNEPGAAVYELRSLASILVAGIDATP